MTWTMAVARTPRSSWITAGLRALATGGVDAVRIESLARVLRVSKGGFYWYFADRQALLEEMLDTWERDVTTAVIERVEAAVGDGDARTKLRRLFAIANSPGDLATDTATDSAIRDWSRRDPAVADRLRRVDNRRMDYLRELFCGICPDPDEAEIRATLCFTMWVGARFMVIDHGDRTPEEVSDLMGDWLLK